MLATDGVRSFAIFYYDDTVLQNRTSSGVFYLENYSHMGYNTTDGVNQFIHPQSFSRDIINVFNTSNVGIPGVWIFRLDQPEAPSLGCTPRSFGNSLHVHCLQVYNVNLWIKH